MPRTRAQLEVIGCLLLGLSAWALVAYKAFAIPITHDELGTIVHYRLFSVWEIMMYPDPWPNNHILNTLLTKATVALFGQEQWAVRLPSVLSFGLYAGAAYGIGGLLFPGKPLVRVAAFSLFLANPYLLDFFSLCRGYGMACAFFLAGAGAMLFAYLRDSEKALWWAVVLATLAAYANFTLLIFWGPMVLMAGLFLLLRTRQAPSSLAAPARRLAPLMFFSLAFLALIWTPIRKMTSTNQFQYWESNSFFQDTVLSLVINYRYGAPDAGPEARAWAIAVVLLCLLALLYVLYRGWKEGWRQWVRQPLSLALSLLFLAVLTNRLQAWALGTPNLINRTALGFYPAFTLMAVAGFAEGLRWHARWARLLLLGTSLWFLWHSMARVNLNSVREWWYDAHTFEVLGYLEDQVESGQTVSLATSWYFHRSFDFYDRSGDYPFLELSPYNKAIDLTDPPNYFYVMRQDVEQLEEDYVVVDTYAGQFFLMRRKR